MAAKEGKFIGIRREKPPQMNEHSELRSGSLWLCAAKGIGSGRDGHIRLLVETYDGLDPGKEPAGVRWTMSVM